MASRRTRPRRIVLPAVIVGFFGGLAGQAMYRNDAWSAWLGLELERPASIAVGAVVGALFGVFASLTGSGRARRHGHPGPGPGSGPGDGGNGGGGNGGG